MSRFTAVQKTEILAQARKNIAPVASLTTASQTKYVEQDVAELQAQIAALRADISELRTQHEALASQVYAQGEDIADARSYTKNAPAVQSPQAGGETPWWQWVDQRIESALEDLHEDVGLALGTMIERVRDELDQQTSAGKREHELLRREFGVLQNEVKLERELDDLRSQVATAQKAVPKIPANRGSAPRGGHDGETVGRAIAKAKYARRTYGGPFLEGEAKPVRTVNLIASPLGRR